MPPWRTKNATGFQAVSVLVHGWDLGVVRPDGFLDHLPDRERLAAAARSVAGQKPVEAGLRIVRGRLLRQQHDETVPLRKSRPARAEIVTRGGLRAAVQHDDQRRRASEAFRHVCEHAQRAGIRTEAGQLGEMRRGRRRRVFGGGRLQQRRPMAAVAGQGRECWSKFAQALLPLFGESCNASHGHWLLHCDIIMLQRNIQGGTCATSGRLLRMWSAARNYASGMVSAFALALREAPN